MLRPVAVRTSFNAASTASVPVGPQNWIFASARQLGRQQTEQVLHELILDRRGQVEGVQRQFITQHLLDSFDHHRVVMPQRQGAGTGQAVDELAAFHVFHVDALGAFERQGNAPRVTAGIGLLLALTGQQRRFVELIERFHGRRADSGALLRYGW